MASAPQTRKNSVKPVARLGVVLRLQTTEGSSFIHRLPNLQNHDVGTLYLPIRHGVSYGDPVHPDVVILAEVQELSTGELGAIVGDDGVRDPKAMDDVGEERHRLFRPDAV
jgi:hypothetical protein